jgi:hypothetical protein
MFERKKKRNNEEMEEKRRGEERGGEKEEKLLERWIDTTGELVDWVDEVKRKNLSTKSC